MLLHHHHCLQNATSVKLYLNDLKYWRKNASNAHVILCAIRSQRRSDLYNHVSPATLQILTLSISNKNVNLYIYHEMISIATLDNGNHCTISIYVHFTYIWLCRYSLGWNLKKLNLVNIPKKNINTIYQPPEIRVKNGYY